METLFLRKIVIVGKNKLERFAELETLPNTLQPKFDNWADVFEHKGLWNKDIFKNDNPIVLEVGCGKGEYTVGLAKQYPEKNFIGIDRKGARIWRGAKTAHEEHIHNIRFLRIDMDKIDQCFGDGEVSEIWITFPDPQPQKSRMRKRLTAPGFLNRYKNILAKEGIDAHGIRGYENEEFTHSAIATAILAKKADVGMGVKSIALENGLDFIQLKDEIFFLAMNKELSLNPDFAKLIRKIRVLSSASPGYKSIGLKRQIAGWL